jgi:hypothetical protein
MPHALNTSLYQLSLHLSRTLSYFLFSACSLFPASVSSPPLPLFTFLMQVRRSDIPNRNGGLLAVSQSGKIRSFSLFVNSLHWTVLGRGGGSTGLGYIYLYFFCATSHCRIEYCPAAVHIVCYLHLHRQDCTIPLTPLGCSYSYSCSHPPSHLWDAPTPAPTLILPSPSPCNSAHYITLYGT